MTDASIVIDIRGKTEGGKRVKRTLDDIAKSGKKAETSVTKLDKEVKKADKSFKGLKASAGGILAISAAFLATAAAFTRLSDQFLLLEARVKNSTRSTQEFEQAMTSLLDISKRTGSEFSTTVEVFQRLSFVRDEIKASVEEMTTFVDGVQKLGIVSGASTQALNAGLTQLGQGLGAGVLRAEEFNSIVENIPAVANAIAEEFGVTTGQLRNLVLEGAVLSEDVFSAILNQSEQINQEFSDFPMTVSRAFNELKIGFTSSISQINETTNSTKVLIGSLQVVGGVVKTITGLFIGFANTFKAVFSAVVSEILIQFNNLTNVIKSTINLAIRGINLIKKEDINLLQKVDNDSFRDAAGDDFFENIKKAGEGFRSSVEPISDIFFNEGEIKTASGAVRELTQDYSLLSDKISKSKDEEKELAKQLRETQRQIDKFSNSAADAFTGFITGANSAKDALRGLINDMLSLVNRKFITEPLSKGIGSILGGLGGGDGGAGFFGKLATAGAGLVGFNNGGSMMLGGAGGIDQNLLSLNGSPIARVSRGERMDIVPQGKQKGGAIVVNQTINVATGVVQTVRSEIQSLMPKIQESTRSAIKEADLRGVT